MFADHVHAGSLVIEEVGRIVALRSPGLIVKFCADRQMAVDESVERCPAGGGIAGQRSPAPGTPGHPGAGR